MTTSETTTQQHDGGRRIGLAAMLALVLMAGYFLYTGSGDIDDDHLLLFGMATVIGLFMAFNIGGNDVANSFGTSVGAGTLSVPQALLVASVFEVSGAVIAGGEVISTVRSGIVELDSIGVTPPDFVYIMMSALVAAALWLLFASWRGLPVSTTHAIVGAIVGSSIMLALLTSGADAALGLVRWHEVSMIALSWVLSPLLGGAMAYGLYSLIKTYILDYNEQAESRLKAIQQEKRERRQQHKAAFERLSELQQVAYTQAMARDLLVVQDDNFSPEELESDLYRDLYSIDEKRHHIDAHHALETWVPLVAAFGAMLLSAMLLFKGLGNISLNLDTLSIWLIMGMVGAVVWMATFIFAKTLKAESLGRASFLMFSWMQVFTASGFAFSHGSNDIANAIGPFVAIVDVLRTGRITDEAHIPPLAMLTFGIALVAGLWFIGRRVIKTVGHDLTRMHPASGFSAELAATAVIMMATLTGIPVSSTHILIGSVLGIGLVNRRANWKLMRPIALAWVITLPAAALIAALAFLGFRAMNPY